MTEAPQAQGSEASADVQPSEAQSQQTEERTFTQADLNKIAANEKRDGKQAAISELLKQTGAESIDDVLSAYTEYKGIQEAVETEADKAKKAHKKAEDRAKTAEEKYTTTVREFALRDALRDAGINSARLPLALKVADMSTLDVSEDGVAGVEDAVEALKEASPEWFEESRQRVNAPQTSGEGMNPPRGFDAQIQEALDNKDHTTADRLQRKKLQAQGKFKIGA